MASSNSFTEFKIVLMCSRIVKTIKMAEQSSRKPDAINKLKQILGVTQQDDVLVNYWSQLCD